MNKDVVKELNAFLKGQYMGIHAYEHYIQSTKDPLIKKELQEIQQDHKNHAMKVAERIQNLGGEPVTDEGIVGSVQNAMSRLATPYTTEGMLQNALKGEEHYGIELSEEMVKGDLDEESRMLVEEIIDRDRQHLEKLDSLLH